MLLGNCIELKESLNDIRLRLLLIEILAESIPVCKYNRHDISFLLLDALYEIKQYFVDIDTLISCDNKGVVINANVSRETF